VSKIQKREARYSGGVDRNALRMQRCCDKKSTI
jgi:hypothetical protein